jgi:hypothetical protein
MSDPTLPALVTEPQTSAATTPFPVRRVVATALIWLGALIAVTAAGASFVQFMGLGGVFPLPVIVGYLIFIAGWVLLPAVGWRRPVAAVIAFLALWLYLHTFPGPWTGLAGAFGLAGGAFGDSVIVSAVVQSLATTGVVVTWLIARNRRPIAYLALAPVWLISLIAAIVSFRDSSRYWSVPFLDLFLATPLPAAVCVSLGVLLAWVIFVAGGAWLAVGLERWIPKRATRSAATNRSTGVEAEQSGTRTGTNTLAILALVFGIGGGILGIVFGHLARAQIRRSGEQGWGLATAGLVLGYIGVGASVLIAIVYVVIIAAVLG